MNEKMEHSVEDGRIRVRDVDSIACKIDQAKAMSIPVFMMIIATKPCYIKLSPVILEAKRRGFPMITVDTGHHYSQELTGAVHDFGITEDIDVFLNIRGSILERTSDLAIKCQALAEILRQLNVPLNNTFPIVSGDTSTSATFPLFWYFETGGRCIHIEAGLRSRSPFGRRDIVFEDVKHQREADWALVPDEPFPEGIDTRVTSAVARRFYAPLENNSAELLREGYSENDIIITGSLSADAVEAAHKVSEVIVDGCDSKRLRFDVHRRENMSPGTLAAIVGAAITLSDEGYDVSFVLTNQIKFAFERYCDRGFLQQLDAAHVECQSINPSYTDFLRTIATGHYRALITDSGGLQEESAILGVPCCTLRYSTDRPETVLSFQSNILAPPANDQLITQSIEWFLQQPMPRIARPYGTDVSGAILSDLARHVGVLS